MGETNIFLNERLKKGYTQIELAKKTGISQATISRLENDADDIDKCIFKAVKKLCKVLDIDINKL